MKKLAILAAVGTALIVPATASAGVPHSASCRPVYHGFTQELAAYGVSCTTARTIEQYFVNHEILTRTVTVTGVRWNFHRWSSIDDSFTFGSRVVYVLHLPSN